MSYDWVMRKPCSIIGCGAQSKARGLCNTHLKWDKEGRNLHQEKAYTRFFVKTVCLVPNCEDENTSNGYCAACNLRWRRNIGPLAPRKARGKQLSFIDSNGYERYTAIHPLNKYGTPRPAHRIVMEQSLGRELVEGENVHHINGDRTDNRIENLELWNTSQPAGQRVEDKVAWAREILALYNA